MKVPATFLHPFLQYMSQDHKTLPKFVSSSNVTIVSKTALRVVIALVSNAITSLRTGPPFRPRTLGFTTYPSCTYLGPHVRGCSSHHTHAVGCYHTYTHPLDTTATM